MKQQFCLIALSALALAGCGGKDAAPTGQVAATVHGKEITSAEVNAEAASLGNGPGAQGEALNRLVVRQLMVDEARKRKLDKTPQAAMVLKQAEDMALVQLLAGDMGQKVPKVSDDEVNEFIRNNPANTTQRRLLFVDQLVVPDATEAFLAQLKPLHSLAEVEALLNKEKLKFRRAAAVLDTSGMDPQQAAAIVAVGQSDIFYSTSGRAVQISGVIASRLVPLEGEDARNAARAFLSRQRTLAQLQGQMAQIIGSGKEAVKINEAYKAKSAPAAAKGAPAK